LALTPGTHFGVYEMITPIGEGADSGGLKLDGRAEATGADEMTR
jgi:hypothetical protein